MIHFGRSLLRATMLAGIAASLASCALVTSLPEPTTLKERVAMIPTRDLPVAAPVTIRWNPEGIPFVEAESDADLAFGLGMVHAHLRLGQMELLRRVATGRLSEMGSVAAVEIDEALRILDLARVAPDVVAAMPPETRRWAERFVEGINTYAARAGTRPHEFDVLGIEFEPWSVEDVVTVGRLASVDVTWLRWFTLLPLRDREDWPLIKDRVLSEGVHAATSLDPDAPDGLRRLSELLGGLSKSGSNSFAVAAERSATGSALIASDPHLGLFLPNLWLVAGMRSPSVAAVGLMVPGLPFIAVGRNEEIAWGGTNLQSANSDLIDVSGLPADQITMRREKVGVRWWLDDEVEARDTPYGPIISDASVFPGRDDETLALSWIGHRATDELTAMLAMNRARSWPEFRTALRGFAISGQAFVYADRSGDVGVVTATMVPRRPASPPPQLVLQPGEYSDWSTILTSRDLPAVFEPPSGIIASANNPVAPSENTIGYFYSNDDRVLRLNTLLAERSDWTPEGMKAIQRDVYRHSAVVLRDAVLEKAGGLDGLDEEESAALALARAWDGNYDADSREALAAESMLAGFSLSFSSEDRRKAYGAFSHGYEMLTEDVNSASASDVEAALRAGLAKSGEALREFGTWGDMHRLRLAHPLSNLPVVGRRYVFADLPTGGSTTTIMKRAHDVTTERHDTRYGANARHVSDMSDLDANWFVLLGGSDGWINSANFRDQADAWREDRMIRVPLSPAGVASAHGIVTRLTGKQDPGETSR